MTVLNIILVTIILFLIYGLWRSLMNYELLEERYEKIGNLANSALDQLRAVDIRGSFEADDEVGSVFKDIKEIVELFKETYDNTGISRNRNSREG